MLSIKSNPTHTPTIPKLNGFDELRQVCSGFEASINSLRGRITHLMEWPEQDPHKRPTQAHLAAEVQELFQAVLRAWCTVAAPGLLPNRAFDSQSSVAHNPKLHQTPRQLLQVLHNIESQLEGIWRASHAEWGRVEYVTPWRREPVIEVHVRWMLDSDIAAVLKIEQGSFAQPRTEQELRKEKARRGVTPLVAEDPSNKVCGFSFHSLPRWPSEVPNPHDLRYRQLRSLAVDPHLRFRGIGKGIIDALVGDKPGLPIGVLEVPVSERNDSAIQFLSRSNLVTVPLIGGVRAASRRSSPDEIVMRRMPRGIAVNGWYD